MSRSSQGLPRECTNALKSRDWYDPVLAGAETFKQYLFRRSVFESVLQVLSTLEDDEYSKFLQDFLQNGLNRHGDNWRYADICTVLYVLAEYLEVSDYLEIGVRRGRSLGMVASSRPQARIAGFDLWQENYAGLDNPGPSFVCQELDNLGYTGIHGRHELEIAVFL